MELFVAYNNTSNHLIVYKWALVSEKCYLQRIRLEILGLIYVKIEFGIK